MISLAELKRRAAEDGVDVATVEKDYALGWFLGELFSDKRVTENFVFKGGTALRKTYFKDFRFSQDIDFTLTEALSVSNLREIISSACDISYRNSSIEFSLVDLKQTSNQLGKEVFEGRVSLVGPRQHRGSPSRIKLDLTCYEEVILPAAGRSLIHPYSDECQAKIAVYQLEEIVAEKSRTLLQRAHPRDFYDVWRVLKFHRDMVEEAKIAEVFFEKCEYKNVDIEEWSDYFQAEKVLSSDKHFRVSLKHQLKEVPEFETVRSDLLEILTEMFS